MYLIRMKSLEPFLALATILFTIPLSLLGTPRNDDFGGRILIVGQSFSEEITDFSDATLQPGEPRPGVPNGIDFFPSVWYEWTVPETGWYQFDTISGGASPRVTMSVYLSETGDFSSMALIFRDESNPALVRMPAMAGTKLYIQLFRGLYDWESFPVSFRFNISPTSGVAFPSIPFAQIESPINDLFEDAIEIQGPARSILGYDRYASLEDGELYLGGAGKSIWYKYTPAQSGDATLSIASFVGGTFPQSSTSEITLWRGKSLSSLAMMRSFRFGTQTTVPPPMKNSV